MKECEVSTDSVDAYLTILAKTDLSWLMQLIEHGPEMAVPKYRITNFAV